MGRGVAAVLLIRAQFVLTPRQSQFCVVAKELPPGECEGALESVSCSTLHCCFEIIPY